MKNFNEKIKQIFKKYGTENLEINEFIQVEMLLLIISKLNTKVKASDGWSVVTKYFNELAIENENNESKKYIFLMREKYLQLGKKRKWNELLSEYFCCSDKIRLYNTNEDGYIVKNNPKYEVEREKIYYKELDNIMKSEKKYKKKMAEEVIEYSSKYKKQNNFENKIYSTDIYPINGSPIEELPKYKEKIRTTISSNIDWNSVLNKMGENFRLRPNIKLKILNEEQDIKVKGNIHIVGALGAGKSTFKYAYVFKSVKENKCKVGIIEDNVANVITTVIELRKLGINAIPIIGESNELKHLVNYYKTISDEQILNDDIMKFLSGNCIVKSLTNDVENITEYPCNKLKEMGTSVMCPYCNVCGKMYRFREISSADVLVTTPYSLIKGNMKNFIDPYRRSVYEIFYDLLDFIIVDEADGVQSILDSELMPYGRLNYGSDNILDKVIGFKDELTNKDLNLQRQSIYSFCKNIVNLNAMLPLIKRILLSFKKIKIYIQNKILTPLEIFNDIKETLEKNDVNSEFIGYLSEYCELVNIDDISEKILNHPLNRLLQKIENIHNVSNQYPESKLYDEIEKLLIDKKVELPLNKKGKNIDREAFIEKIEFLVILVQLDYLIRIIVKEYSSLQYKYKEELIYIDGIQNLSKKIMKFVKEPCIGTLYGYKFMFDKDVKIDIMRYAGVGRSLLEDWPFIKKDIGLDGPAIICLSGTSYSPGSAHYNLKNTPDILLLSEKPEGKIDMKFLCKTKNENFIRISGTKLDYKEENLKNLTKSIIRDIRFRIEKGKKILIIVNSYSDCELVANVLSIEKNLNYSVVGKEYNKDEKVITKDNLENFETVTDGADICIVPLMIISRGYNILTSKKSENGEFDSYFDSAFFLIRPYMVPGDFKSYIQILHYNLDNIIDNIKKNEGDYSKRLDKFRKLCFAEYNNVISIGQWKKLSEKERDIMSWFMMIPIKQAIGRMQRNGNNCEVIFCDSAYCEAVVLGKEQDSKNSIFYAWHELLEKNMNNEVIKNLFGNFNNSLKNLIKDINNEYIMEDDYE